MTSKAKIVALIPVFLIGTLLTVLFALSLLEPEEALTLEEIQQLSEPERERALESIFRNASLPSGEEANFILWAMLERPQQTFAFIRQYHNRISGIGEYLSRSAILLLRNGNRDAAISVLSLARELLPNDPDVLGATGIMLLNMGRADEALEYLERAQTWRVHQPLYDFYLGGLLLQSEQAHDKTRGKRMLMRAMVNPEEGLLEPSGLMLLADRGVPLLASEFTDILQRLQDFGTFRADNPLLASNELRIIINRSIGFAPQKAVELTAILLQMEDADMTDRIAAITLFQRYGEGEKAGELLSAIDRDQLPADLRNSYNILHSTQHFIDGDIEQGIRSLEGLFADGAEPASLKNALLNILNKRPELTREQEQQLLTLYMSGPVTSVSESLAVAARLIEITPLRDTEWYQLVAEKLLPLSPVPVAGWLNQRGQARLVITSLTASPDDIQPPQALALFESYFTLQQLDQAEAMLQQLQSQLPPAVEAFIRTRLQISQQDFDNARESWRLAHQLAMRGQHFALIKDLGVLAAALDQPISALESLQTALNAGIRLSESEADILLNLNIRHSDLEQTLAVARYMVAAFGEQPMYVNNLAYLDFLNQTNLDEQVEVMRALADDNPGTYQYQLTLALGLLRQGRAREANRLIDQASIDWPSVTTRGRLIYALVLAENGQRAAATAILQGVGTEGLMPAEISLLNSLN